MNILLVTSDEVAKELLPILQGKGWNTLTSSRDNHNRYSFSIL